MNPARLGVRRRLRIGSAVVLLVGVTALAPGCGLSGSLTEAANDLQSALLSMPGVTDAWVYHEASYAEGVIFNIAVDVPAATRQQIVAVAERIDVNHINLVSNYTKNVEFRVSPDRPVTLRRQAHFDALQIADDAQQLRAMASQTDGRLEWFRSQDDGANQLSIDQSQGPGAALLDVVRLNAAQTGLTVSVSPAAPSRQSPRLVVTFPFSTEQQTTVSRLADQVPADVFGMRVDSGTVRAMQVMVHDPASAERDLTAVVDASRALGEQPMTLAWYYPGFHSVPVYGGVADVHDCSPQQVGGVQNVAHHLGADAGVSTLQARLQSHIDACPAQPAPLPIESATPPETSNRQDTTADNVNDTSDAVLPVPVPELRDRVAERTRVTRAPTAPCPGVPGCVAGGPGRAGSDGGGSRPKFPSPRPVLPGSTLAPEPKLPRPAEAQPSPTPSPTPTPTPTGNGNVPTKSLSGGTAAQSPSTETGTGDSAGNSDG